MIFRWITLGDLLLGFTEFSQQQAATFAATETGKFYGPKLAKMKTEIEDLPDALKGARPMAEELADADAEHDALGSAIWYYVECIVRHPLLSEPVKQAALRIRKAFIPSLAVLTAAFASEANAALDNRPKRKELETELKLFPMPGTGGETLDDWAGAFLDAGDTIGTLLRERAIKEAGAAGAEKTKAVRVAAISLLHRAREALVEEIQDNPALPRNLDLVLFGYFDKLEQMRAEAGAARIAARKARQAAAPDEEKSGEATGATGTPGEPSADKSGEASADKSGEPSADKSGEPSADK
jgi:hypothetical protein